MNNTKLGAIFYPTETAGKKIPFESLYLPYIWKEIYFDGVYIDILNQRTGMKILDVGSQIGLTVKHFIPHAKKIYSIEPSPEHFEALQANKTFNHWDNVELFNVALADKDGETTLTQNESNRTTNTIVIGDKVGENEYKFNYAKGISQPTIKAGKGYKNQVKVKTVAFDTFFKQNKIEQVDFCKFDVEGAEDLILRSEGFKKVYEKIKAIEIEFHFPTWRLLADYLVSLGYSPRVYPTSAIIILFTR